MSDLPLTVALGDYDRIAPLRTGDVTAKGLNLNLLSLDAPDIFSRMCEDLEFDASEMSMGAHLYLTGRGNSPFVAMPAFPSRAFRHSMLYANVDSGIDTPEDLNGKRIAIREWGMTAVIWAVGILGDEHGFDLKSAEWVAAVPARASMPIPDDVRLRLMTEQENLSDLLESGEVDAALIHHPPECFAQGSTRVRRVFADYAKAEREFYQRTKMHPIMHCVVMREDIYRQNKWALRSLYDALVEAKAHAASELRKTGTLSAMLPFLQHAMDDTAALFGDDWWPYGLGANHECLARMMRYVFEQGLTPTSLEPEQAFSAARNWGT